MGANVCLLCSQLTYRVYYFIFIRDRKWYDHSEFSAEQLTNKTEQ